MLGQPSTLYTAQPLPGCVYRLGASGSNTDPTFANGNLFHDRKYLGFMDMLINTDHIGLRTDKHMPLHPPPAGKEMQTGQKTTYDEFRVGVLKARN